MHIWLHKLEKLADAMIAPLLILLLLILVGELFLADHLEDYAIYTDVFDLFLTAVFTVDLGFKFHRTRKIPKFLKMYWMQILAIIPFFLIFRFTEFLGLNELFYRGQTVLHELPEAQAFEKGTVTLVSEAGRAGRTARLIRMFRFVSRLPRFLGAVPFFEKPTGGHHWYEKRRKNKRRTGNSSVAGVQDQTRPVRERKNKKGLFQKP